eukprot:s430_g12.t2
MSFMILKDRPESSVVVTEARDRAGGNITTMSDSNGRLWEEGPNSFQPGDAILTVACDVGLQWLGQEEDIMLADPNSYRFVWWEGSLRALPATPADAVLGNFLTWPGKIRAGLGAVGIKERCISNVVRFGEPMPEKEESVKEFVTRNLGEEVWVSVVAPLSGLQQRTTGSRNGHPVSAMSEASGQRSISEGFWSLLGRDNDAEDEVPTDAEPLEEDCPFDEEERQLLGRRRELKALLLASRQRADALASAIDAQVDEVMCQEKQRMHVIDELSQHCSDLQHAQEQRQQELLQELEKLNAATQQCSECENRSQFLVERIITLLACSPLDAEHVGVLKTKHRAEREMLRQFEDIRQQYDEVRQQNVELTSRLLEESSFSRRLSDQLAEAEERFNRCTQDGSLQSSSASREGALPEASTATWLSRSRCGRCAMHTSRLLVGAACGSGLVALNASVPPQRARCPATHVPTSVQCHEECNSFSRLDRLWQTIQERQQNPDASRSWVSRLLSKGPDKCAQKVGEDRTEGVVKESADLRLGGIGRAVQRSFTSWCSGPRWASIPSKSWMSWREEKGPVESRKRRRVPNDMEVSEWSRAANVACHGLKDNKSCAGADDPQSARFLVDKTAVRMSLGSQVHPRPRWFGHHCATSTLHLAAPLDFPRCEVDEGPAGDSRREDAGGPAGWTPPVAPRSARARRPVGALGVLAEAEGTWLSDQKWIEALHSLCKSTPTLKCIKRDARSCKSLCIRAKEKAADFLTTRKRSRCKEFQDSQDGDSDMDEDQIDMGTLGDGDSQPIEDGAGETEEDSEGDGEDIPASQPVDTQVIDLQTPEKEWEYFQESQTPETPPTLPDPNEFSPTLADAKKELFTDAPMPPPKCLPKKYDNKIRSAASAPPEIILATPDQDTQDLGCDHLDKLADMMKQSELDSVLADDSDMPPPVLRRAQLRRKNGEDELDEGEAKDTKPMKRPASNRGRGGKGRGRGKAAKKEVEDQESARGEGEDSGPVGSIPAETEGVEDGPPEVDVPHEEETTGSGAKRKAKAKVVVKPKEKVVKPKEKVVKPKEKVAKGKEKVVKPKEKVAKGKGKAKAMSTPMKAKKKHPQDMCHSMAQRKIPAWRMRLTNDHDYDRVEYILVDETIWRKAAPVAVAPPQDSDDEAPPAPTVRSMSKADPAAPSLRGVEALSRLALPDTSDEEEEPGNKRKGKSGTVSDMSSGAEVHRIVGIGDRYPECRVPCSHAVATAKAAVNDSPNGHTRALREFASVNPKDAEDGAHQIFKKYGLTIPLPIHKTDLGAEGVEQFPILKFSDWLRYLMDNCRFSQLCGVKTVEEMMETLREFWVRFEKVYPQHEIFRRFRAGTVVPSLCLPVYSHTDEGRTYQKQGILIVSTHGALGRGTRSFIAKQVKKNHLKKPPMGMNFVGKTLSTQFLCCALLRSVYADDDTPFRKVMSYYAEDMNMLATQGVWNTPKTLRMWALHIGTKADLPALIKAGNFERTFRHVPKASSSRKPCGGICHLCLAGQEAPVHHPFEDFLPTATWTNTLFHVRPWADDNEPEIIQGLPLSREKPEDFFKLDLWHTFHAGLGKVWIGASLVCISEFGVPGNSVESKLEWINNDWHSFCRMKKICPSLKIERKTLSYPQTSAYPEGHWLWEHVPSTSLSLGCMVKAIGFTVMLPFRWQLAARNSLSVLEGALTFATNEASTDFMGSPSAIAFVIFLYA